MSDEELHVAAWSIVQARIDRARAHSIADHREAAGTGRTSDELTTIVTAAQNGRVRELFVALGEQRWGRLSPDGVRPPEVHDAWQPGDIDLLDYAVIETVKKGGRAHPADREQLAMPDGVDGVAATFRYWPVVATLRRGMADPVDPATESETRQLLTEAARQDRGAIERLLVRHLPGLEAFVRLRMGAALRSRTSPPDLVQSVCREVLEDLTDFEFRGEAPFRHWLYTRAENKLREKHRYHNAAMRSADREVAAAETGTVMQAYQTLCTPSRDLEVREAMARIEAAFDSLPDDYREAITLHKLCGLSHAEIAVRMNRSEGAARNLVYRGLSRLALLVDDGDPEAGGAGG